MYESPINIIISKLCTKLESDCIKSVQRYGFDVDKEELAKALNYDRKQYEKGHTDGYNKAIDDFAEKLKRENKETIPTHSGYCRMSFDEVVDDLAEQLKEGVSKDEMET